MNLERAFSLIRQLQGAVGGKSWRSGEASITFAAGTTSATTTVTHGLGATPTAAVATAKLAPAFGKIPTLNTSAYGPTTFDVNGEIDSAHSGAITFTWVATG